MRFAAATILPESGLMLARQLGRGGHGYIRPHHRRKDLRAAAGDRRRARHGPVDVDLSHL